MDKAALEAALQGLEGDIALTVTELMAGERFAFRAEAPFTAASLIKLPVMAAAFGEQKEGRLDFAQTVTVRQEHKVPSCGALTYLHNGLAVTVEDLVTLMIILSDNTAANLLIDLMGIDTVNRWIQRLELKNTCLRRKLFDAEAAARGLQNTVCAADMERLLILLFDGELVDLPASRAMLNMLKNQRLNGKMPFYLHDKGIACAHKTGEDDGITHDVGIIFARRPVVMCFLSENTQVPAAELALQKVAAISAGV